MSESLWIEWLRHHDPENWQIKVSQIELYKKLFMQFNAHTNLASAQSMGVFDTVHLLDSLSVIPIFPPKVSDVADIGSGGGLPSIPLAIFYPHLEFYLIEANKKKARFLEQTANEVGLKNIQVICARVEELTSIESFQHRFSLIISRAFAKIDLLVDLSLKLLRKNGFYILWKSSDIKEKSIAIQFIKSFGGQVIQIMENPFPEILGARLFWQIQFTQSIDLPQKTFAALKKASQQRYL